MIMTMKQKELYNVIESLSLEKYLNNDINKKRHNIL